MKNTSNIQTLTERLNNFPCHWEMNSNQSTWDEGFSENKKLTKAFEGLTTDELIQIKSETTLPTEMIDRYFAEFFQNLPLPATEAKASVNRSQIFTDAWYFFNKGIYETFSEALKAAWKRNRIINALKSGTIALKFRKTSGEIRIANATLKLATEYKAKTEAKYTPDVIKFVTADGWRSARIERILAA